MKLFLLTIILSFSFLFASAQIPTWQWAEGSMGNNEAQTNCIAADNNGNSYAAGYLSSDTLILGKDTLTLHQSDYNPMFIVKYNPSGNIVWAEQAFGAGETVCTGIVTDFAGDIYVTGWFAGNYVSFGNYTLNNTNNYNTANLFVAKYKSDGQVEWAKTTKGSGDDYAYAITVDANKNTYITGGFGSDTLTIGNFTLTNPDNDNNSNITDIFVAKYDSTGNVVWAKKAGAEGYEQGQAITVDLKGDVYVEGTFNSDILTMGSTQLMNEGKIGGQGVENIFIAKYNSVGNVLWAKSGQGAFLQEEEMGISVDAKENAYITGSFWSNELILGSDTLQNAYQDMYGGANGDVCLAKFDSSGNVLWAKNFGGTYDDGGTGIITDVAGHSFVTGYFGSAEIKFGNIILNKTDSLSEGNDIFVAEFDSSGNTLWAISAGGNGSDNGKSIAKDMDEDLFITGNFNSPVISFGKNELTTPDSTVGSIFVAKLGMAISGIQEENALPGYSAIYPNPTNGNFILVSNNTSPSRLIITNLFGKQVYASQVTSNKVQIDLSQQAKGIYFYRLQNSSNALQTGKIIIE